MWDIGLTFHWSIKQLVRLVLRGLGGVKALKVERCEPCVGCKATQIKCGQIPNGNDSLSHSSLRGHLLPYNEGALITLLRHTHLDLT